MHFINAYIYTSEGEAVLNGYLCVDGGKITGIGRMADYKADEGETVVDLRGRRIYPGFVDAHTHLGMWEDGMGFDGSDLCGDRAGQRQSHRRSDGRRQDGRRQDR